MLFFLICAAFALFPDKVLYGAGTGLALCMNAVIPSLLPFMVVSGCIIKSNFARPLGAVLSKVITPVTGISSAGCVCFVTGLVGGYGAGARAVLESYRQKLISKEEAERLLAFCNNAGPLFVMGTVGVGFFGSKSVGAMLFLVQIITAIIGARVFSGNFRHRSRISGEWIYYKKNKPSTGGLVVKAAVESGSAIITACVFVILFSAVLEVLPFGQYSALGGILEVTRGCSEMSIKGTEYLPYVSTFLSWGGVSVHLQANALCDGAFRMKHYYAGKIFAAVISFLITKASGGDVNILLCMLIVAVAVCLIWNIVGNAICQVFSRQPLFRQQRHS